MKVSIEINTELNRKQKYYYVVTNSNTKILTAKDIIDTVDHKQLTPGVVASDKDDVPVNTNNGTTGAAPSILLKVSTSEFREGQKVYLLTIDQYGNIVMAVSNDLKPYVTITKAP